MKQFRIKSTDKNAIKYDTVVNAYNEKHARYIAIRECGATVVDKSLAEVKPLYEAA